MKSFFSYSIPVYQIYIPLIVAIIICIPSILKIRKQQKEMGINKINRKHIEILSIVLPKGTKDKLKAYAIIKGFKNENEFINHLVNEELKKDQEKMKE